MVAQRAKGTQIPDPFVLDELTLAWLEKRHPTIDPDIAAERFSFWASEYMYANWMKTFQNFITREADNNKLGPMLRKATPKQTVWAPLLAEAFEAGFRKPDKTETPDQFREALMTHKRPTNRIVNLGSVMKVMK